MVSNTNIMLTEGEGNNCILSIEDDVDDQSTTVTSRILTSIIS